MSDHAEPGYVFWGFTIPKRMLEVLQRYINHGHRPGDFLTAVICNDLQTAISRADDHNVKNLRAYIGYLVNEAPGDCWGSYENMKAWIEKRGKNAEPAKIRRHSGRQLSTVDGLRASQEAPDVQRLRVRSSQREPIQAAPGQGL
jgi:hypothetical protein